MMNDMEHNDLHQQQQQSSGNGASGTYIQRSASASTISNIVMEQRRSQHRIGIQEFLFLVGNRFVYSREYVILYIIMIIVNISLLLWISFSEVDEALTSPIFFFLEIVIGLLLAVEVGVKLAKEKRMFWRKWSNLFDIFVLSLCIISIIISFFGASKFEQIDEALERSLLVIRYIIQFIRLCSFIRSRRKIDQLLDERQGIDDIDFSGLETEPDFQRSSDPTSFSSSSSSALPMGNSRDISFGNLSSDRNSRVVSDISLSFDKLVDVQTKSRKSDDNIGDIDNSRLLNSNNGSRLSSTRTGNDENSSISPFRINSDNNDMRVEMEQGSLKKSMSASIEGSTKSGYPLDPLSSGNTIALPRRRVTEPE